MIIRKLNEEDKTTLAEWIAAEPDHAGSSPEFYFSPKSNSVMHEDEDGEVFAVRYSSALRVDVEFNPNATKERIREALKLAIADAAKQAEAQGFGEIVFCSKAKSLIAFCRLFGFKSCPDYRRVL